MISIRGLLVRAGGFEVRVDSLDVGDGEYMVLMGPSGAGKTLLLETLAGFRRPLRGTIVVGGRDVTNTPPEHRGLSYVPQNYALWPHMTVYDNIAYGLKLRGLPPSEVRRRVREAAELVGIEHLLERRPATLSGGEQQRVALARALVVEPRAVLLDEPLSSLDQATKERVKSLLTGLHRRLGFTAIHVTHDPLEAAELGDRIAVMYGGRVLQVGDPVEIARSPRIPEIAALHGSATVLRGAVAAAGGGAAEIRVGGTVIHAAYRVPEQCTPGSEALVLVRAEDVVLSAEPPAHTSARNILECRVRGVAEKGPLMLVSLDCGDMDLQSLVTRGSHENLGIGEGKRIYAVFKASSVSILRCRH